MFTKKKLKIIIDENNAIILGTGTGLSSAAGFEYGGKNLYKRLYALVQWKNYFVITTNVDHQFQKMASIKKDFFICKGIMNFFNAVELAIIKLMIIKIILKKWLRWNSFIFNPKKS